MSLRLVAVAIVSLAIVAIGLTAAHFMLNFRGKVATTTITTISTSLNENETVTRIGPCTNSVPYYIGSTLYTCLDLEVARKFSDVIQKHLGLRNGIQIIMFGLTTCPHCHVMYEFFTNNNEYHDIYTVIWLDETEDGKNVFEDLYHIEISNGINPRIAGAVPHIYIVKNGFVYTVVVGRITEKAFWDELIGL